MYQNFPTLRFFINKDSFRPVQALAIECSKTFKKFSQELFATAKCFNNWHYDAASLGTYSQAEPFSVTLVDE